MSTSPDLYALLGVPRTASDADIKQAYRHKAREFHPDRNPGDADAETRFKEVAFAYDILSDPEKKLQYDRFGRVFTGRAGQGGGGPFPQGDGDLGETLGRVFKDLFGSNPFRRSERGDDLRYTITLTLEEAARGMEKEIQYRRKEACTTCKGSGARNASGRVLCNACGGSGEDRSSSPPRGLLGRRGKCSFCQGVGTVPAERCEVCSGRGLLDVEVSLKVRVPAGIDTGQQLQVKGKGNRAKGSADNTPLGDLMVVVNIREHAFFQRHGTEIFCDLPLSFADAALGAQVEIPTLESRATIRIPPGTQPGAVFTLKGRGLPTVKGPSRRGDLHVRTILEVPSQLSPVEQQKLRELSSSLVEESELRRRWRNALEGSR